MLRTNPARWGALLLSALSLVGSLPAQGVGPELPPGFYGILPEKFPPAEAPEGIRRLALVYSTCLVGEIDPCG